MSDNKNGECPDVRSAPKPLVSLLVPVYNEEDTIGIFIEKVYEVLNHDDIFFNVIFVDDGSKDNTLPLLVDFSNKYKNISIISLSRNFGKEAALTAAIDYADGDVLVPIDVDLQDPPELIKQFIEKWREGYDVVYGLRLTRETDTATKRLTSGWFYNLFNKLSNIRIPENAGDFRLIDRKVANSIKLLPERSRFMKGLFSWVGFKSIGVPYSRPSRVAGSTKWNYWKLWNFALDGITGFSTVPIRMWSYVGALISIFSFLYAAMIVVKVIIFGIDVPGYASLLTAVLFFGGVQLLSIGIIGEYVGRLYVEIKGRPIYIVDKQYLAEKS